MVLQEDRNTRHGGSQRQNIVGEIETMHVQHIGGEIAQQLAEAIVRAVGRMPAAERQKVIVHAVAQQPLRVRTSLNHGYLNAGPVRTVSYIDQGRPIAEELLRRPRPRVGEKADLGGAQLGDSGAVKGPKGAGPTGG